MVCEMGVWRVHRWLLGFFRCWDVGVEGCDTYCGKDGVVCYWWWHLDT